MEELCANKDLKRRQSSLSWHLENSTDLEKFEILDKNDVNPGHPGYQTGHIDGSAKKLEEKRDSEEISRGH